MRCSCALLQILTGRVRPLCLSFHHTGMVRHGQRLFRFLRTTYRMAPIVHACWAWPMSTSAVGITLML
jgi:hypothetical protein